MSAKINDRIIENVAILAQLNLTDEDRKAAKDDMAKMLHYIDKLNELDTSQTEPMSHIFDMGNVFREDVVTNQDQRQQMLANAPRSKDGQYQVPKTVE